MKNIIGTSFLLGLMMAFTSCSEEWLKPDPLSFLAPENVYVDEAGFEAILVTLGKNLQYESTVNRHTGGKDHAGSDLGVHLVQDDVSRNTDSHRECLPYWTDCRKAYEFIRNANVLISRIDEVESENPAVRNRLLGEAYWHRAYWY